LSFNQLADQDFDRAIKKGFWRKVLTRLTGKTNELLPFEEVRVKLPMRGQHYIGLKQVPIQNIVGSFGRYQDFDRAFLPTQKRTKARWVSINKAHYKQIFLPPVDLFKIGEIFFVKDGNHRVSVAHEQGQEFVDAFVTEINVPVVLTTETKLDDLDIKEAHADFLVKTNLAELRPGADIEMTTPEYYNGLLSHIDVHQWYLGEKQGSEVPYDEALISWYDHIYLPLVEVIRNTEILNEIPKSTEADLALWIMDYLSYLRLSNQRNSESNDEEAKLTASKYLIRNYPTPAVKKMLNVLNRISWLENLIIQQEKVLFLDETQIHKIRPNAEISTTLPGQYQRIQEHIAVHRWYLGESMSREVSNEEAIASWYDKVYQPLVEIIREQEVLKEFPKRTETDLYLWIIEHQWYLRETFGDNIPVKDAVKLFTDDYSEKAAKKLLKALKKIKKQ